MVPGCKVPIGGVALRWPYLSGAEPRARRSAPAVSRPSWFPEADSEARILGHPVVLLSLRIRRGLSP